MIARTSKVGGRRRIVRVAPVALFTVMLAGKLVFDMFEAASGGCITPVGRWTGPNPASFCGASVWYALIIELVFYSLAIGGGVIVMKRMSR